jgi:DNA-binding transcriptional LysR family regulator
MNFRTLDLNLLRVFDTVMVERNVTRAAERLAMSQPAVSNALRRLREAIGEELFVPGSTGVTPTPHAVALWPAIRESMTGLRELFDPQGFDPALDERRFALAMADATAAVILPPLLAAIEHLRVSMQVEPLTTRDPRVLLARGAADAAIGFFPDVARAQDAALGQGESVLDALYGCDYVCAMRRDHPLAQQEPLMLDDYCAAAHVRVSFAGRPHGFVDEQLARLGRSRRVALMLGQYAAAVQVLCHTDLLGVLPRRYVQASGAADALHVTALPFEMPRVEIGLLWHRRHERDAALAARHHRARRAGRRLIRRESSAAPSAAPSPARRSTVGRRRAPRRSARRSASSARSRCAPCATS